MRFSYAVLLLILLPTFNVQAQAASSYQLAAVQATGTKRYTQADVGRVSGLESGQPVTIAQITSAADRLGTPIGSSRLRSTTSSGSPTTKLRTP